MLERTSLLRIALAAVFAASLAAMPLAIKAQEATDPATKSGTAVKGKKTTTPKSKTGDTPPAETKSRQTTPPEPKSTTTETKSGKSLTPGQTAARERQKKCGEEWRGFSDQVKKEKGPTWPKYWSACNTRMKSEVEPKGKKKA